MKLVILKLKNGIEFGDLAAKEEQLHVTSNIPTFVSNSIATEGLLTKCYQDSQRTFYRHSANGRYYQSLFGVADECKKTSALVSYDWPVPEASPESLRLVRCIKDKQVSKVSRKLL